MSERKGRKCEFSKAAGSGEQLLPVGQATEINQRGDSHRLGIMGSKGGSPERGMVQQEVAVRERGTLQKEKKKKK